MLLPYRRYLLVTAPQRWGGVHVRPVAGRTPRWWLLLAAPPGRPCLASWPCHRKRGRQGIFLFQPGLMHVVCQQAGQGSTTGRCQGIAPTLHHFYEYGVHCTASPTDTLSSTPWKAVMSVIMPAIETSGEHPAPPDGRPRLEYPRPRVAVITT